MARPRTPQSVKLFVGLLSGDPDLLRRAIQLVGKRWGPVDLESPVWPFEQTDYYTAEMGPHLRRCFLSFERLIAPARLPEIKLCTNALEQRLADECLSPECARPVNIDPGYLDLAKLILATTKDHGHRVYLDQGIYAEVTLRYAGGAWQPWPWTYPDYRQPEYHAFFDRVRSAYRAQRQALPQWPAPADGDHA